MTPFWTDCFGERIHLPALFGVRDVVMTKERGSHCPRIIPARFSREMGPAGWLVTFMQSISSFTAS